MSLIRKAIRLSVLSEDLKIAADAIRKGELVAFPTGIEIDLIH